MVSNLLEFMSWQSRTIGRKFSHNSFKETNFLPVCHHYGKVGRIRPNCFKMNRLLKKVFNYSGQPRRAPRAKIDLSTTGNQKVWVKKPNGSYNVALMSSVYDIFDNWYFDSCWSRHMTGKKENLLDYKKIRGCYVRFGDVEKGRVSVLELLMQQVTNITKCNSCSRIESKSPKYQSTMFLYMITMKYVISRSYDKCYKLLK